MMPAEEPNKADDLLRRYANKRREQGGDFALHPATRRLLQGEVTRQRGSQRNDGQRTLFTWLTAWRTRVVLGAAAAVLVVFATWMLRDHSPEPGTLQLAKVEENITREAARRPKERLAEVERRAAKDAATTRAIADLDASAEKPVALNGPTPGLARVQDSPLRKANSSDGYPFLSSNASAVLGGVPAATAPATVLNYSVNLAVAPPSLPMEAAFGTTPSTNVQLFGIAPTAGVTLAQSYYDKNANIRSAGASDKRAEDSKRFNEVTQLGLQLEAKQPAQQIMPTTTPADQKLSATAPVSVLVAPSQSIGLGDELSAAKSEAAPAEKAKSQTITTSSGEAGFGAVFYRQTDEADLPQVARTTRRLNDVQKKMEAESAVLTQFTLEQTGNKLRMTEPDGSVYEGALDEGVMVEKTDLETNGAGNRSDSLARESIVQQAGSGQRQYQLRAVGSNVTLRQNVVVSARVTSEEGAAQTPASRGRFSGRAGGATPSRPAPQAPAPRAFGASGGARGRFVPVTNQISAIEGTVRIGLTNEQRFKAVRAP